MAENYYIPTKTQRTSLQVANSRFYATAGLVQTTADTKQFINTVRTEFPDASHHVYAFRLGFGNTVTEGMSDAGEPTGTAGPPILAILRGTNIGDVIVVVTRYFGGTKLGTGGLVRAYSDAARQILSELPIAENIPMQSLRFDCPYTYFESVKRLISSHNGEMLDVAYTEQVTLTVKIAANDAGSFVTALSDLTAGKIQPVTLD